jgi:hypothetical protein
VRLGPGARDWHGRFRASRGTGCLTPRRSAPGLLLNPLLKPRKTSPPGKERDPESESRAVSGAGQGRLPARRGSACGRSPRRVRPSRRGEAPADGTPADEGRAGARDSDARAPLPAVQPARALGPRAGGGPNANLLSGYEPPVGPDQTTEAKTGEINYLWRSKFVPPLQSPSVPGAPFGRP